MPSKNDRNRAIYQRLAVIYDLAAASSSRLTGCRP